jgi:hypothetical protein
MYRPTRFTGMAMIAVVAMSGAAQANDSPLLLPELARAQPMVSEPVITSAPDVLQDKAVSVATGDAPLTDGDLGNLRGGDALVVGNQTLTAINNGTVFTGNYNAGGVSLTDNAFSSFNGLGNIVINTGAQNNLQSAMNVTINFAQ